MSAWTRDYVLYSAGWQGTSNGRFEIEATSCVRPRQTADMSTDVSGMIECRPLARIWGEDDEDAVWHAAIGLFLLNTGNAYDAFACLFGVRNSFGFRPLTEGRGLPVDASDGLRDAFNAWGGPRTRTERPGSAAGPEPPETSPRGPAGFRLNQLWPCPKYAATSWSGASTLTARPPSRSDMVAA